MWIYQVCYKPRVASVQLLIFIFFIGPELEAWVAKQRWTFDSSTGVVSIPPNPDNQIESVVIQEHIKLPREFPFAATFGPSSIYLIICRAQQGHFAYCAGQMMTCHGNMRVHCTLLA